LLNVALNTTTLTPTLYLIICTFFNEFMDIITMNGNEYEWDFCGVTIVAVIVYQY